MYRIKSIPAQVKDVDKAKRQVKLYYSAFNIVDSDGDSIRQGALKKTQAEWGPAGKNRIWHLDNHSPMLRIGKPSEMGEDEYGAWAVTQVRDTQAGKDAMVLYDAGDITEHSFGFLVMKEQRKDEYNELIELRQFEYSSVNWGANMETPTIDVKSQDGAAQMIKEYDKWQKYLRKGTLSDEFCELLEIQLAQWQAQIKALNVEPSHCGTPDRAAELDRIFSNYNRNAKIQELTNYG